MRFDSSIFWNHLYVAEWHTQVDQARVWTQALERLGFTAAWSSEHHFTPGVLGSPPNALLAGVDVINHTTTLRFGGAPWAVMDRHPLMVAEDAAMVDHISHGRLEFGVGRGNPFLPWGSQFVPFADRRNVARNRALFEEVLDIVVKAWTEEALSYKGQFYTIPVPGWKEMHRDAALHRPPFYNADGELVALPVLPKPYQKPHPPIWVMVDSMESYAFAGRKGFNVIGRGRPPEELKPRFLAYKQAIEEAFGREVELGENIGVQFLTYCGETQAEVDRVCSQDDSEDKFVGTPDYYVEMIAACRQECNLQMYQLRPSVGGLTLEQAMASLELFASEVMPHFRDDGAWVRSEVRVPAGTAGD